MPIPGNIATRRVEWAKEPGALVANFVARGIVPGVQQRIRGSLHLLVRGDIDSLISIIVVRAGAGIAGETGCIWHCRVNST